MDAYLDPSDPSSTDVLPPTEPDLSTEETSGPFVTSFRAATQDAAQRLLDLPPFLIRAGNIIASGQGTQATANNFLKQAEAGQTFGQQLQRSSDPNPYHFPQFGTLLPRNRYGLTFGEPHPDGNSSQSSGDSDGSQTGGGAGSVPLADRIHGLEAQIDALQAATPGTPPRPGLVAPNLAQLGAAGLASLLMPKFALQSMAAPFQVQLQKNAIDAQAAAAAGGRARDAYKARLEGLQNDLKMTQWEAEHPFDDSASGGQGASDDPEAPAVKPRVKISLAAIDKSTDAQIRATIARDPALGQAFVLYSTKDPKERPGVARKFAEAGFNFFANLDDDALEHYGMIQSERVKNQGQ